MAPEGAERRVLLCRPGFERDCAEEIGALQPGAVCELGEGWLTGPVLPGGRGPRLRELVFARDQFQGGPFRLADTRDRISPLLELARARAPFAQVWLQHADTGEGRSIGRLCTRLDARYGAALRGAGLLSEGSGRRLHVLFLSGGHGWIGVSEVAGGARWSMGIPRLRLPGAPSRSAAKLEEALLWFLGDEEDSRVRPGMRAVDLGAAPGGWSWVLARRGLKVTAIDHGPMSREALDAGAVQHVRADAFTWRPQRAVDWLVCDVVDKPARVAELIGRWFAEGWCRQAVFNLKLPMKHRQREATTILDRLRQRLAGQPGTLRCEARQLYHDREEITVYLSIR